MERGRGRRYDDRERGGYSGGGGYRRDERPRSRSHERRRSPPAEYHRSPPAREYERPRDYERRRSRSPYGRDRSPGRSRNGGPPYRERSPPRARHQEDRDRYERRDYDSRDGPRRFPADNNYRSGGDRPRSPPRRGYGDSPRSQPMSRRGSPPPQERLRSPAREQAYHGGRSERGYEREGSPPRRIRSPPRDSLPYRDRSPPREEAFRDRSPPRAQDDEFMADADGQADFDGPPTGPSYRGEPIPADSKPPRQDYRESTKGGFHGSSSSRRPYDEDRYDGRPSYDNGPREGRWNDRGYDQGSSRFGNRAPVAAFRGSSNSTATTYPRTQRFNNGPSVVEGGKKQPSLMDSESEKRLQQLEEERKKLEAMIEEKQRKKRSDLRDWDKLEREAKSAQLRSQLAEGHLERLSEIGSSNVY